MPAILRAERRIRRWSGLGLFARVFNVFDTRFFNGAVFTTTGSPYYSRSPQADIVALRDPTRFYPPRRIELGLTWTSRQQRQAGGSCCGRHRRASRLRCHVE